MMMVGRVQRPICLSIQRVITRPHTTMPTAKIHTSNHHNREEFQRVEATKVMSSKAKLPMRRRMSPNSSQNGRRSL